MSRRGRYRTDPVTGIRYEKGSLMDMTNKSSRPNHGGSSYYAPSEPTIGDLPPWAQILLVVLVFVVMLWFFVIQPFIKWIDENTWLALFIGIVILSLLAAAVMLYLKHQKQKEAERIAFEKEQKSKGLVLFKDRHENEKWGKPDEVEAWRREEQIQIEKESIFNRIIEQIERFEPSRRYGNEFGYHTELQGWLKSKFQDAKVELQTGASRPDIVINDIAIEVKGPTDNQALNTLTTKCLKYSHYYKHLIIVLFEPIFSESNYDEIIAGIEKYFPNVKVIRK